MYVSWVMLEYIFDLRLWNLNRRISHMPTFEQLILSPPAGFVASCMEINDLATRDEIKLQQLVRDAWKDIQSNSTSNERANEEFLNIKRGIATVIRAMKNAQPAASLSVTAKTLVSSTLLNQQSVEMILLQVKELSKSTDPEVSAVVKKMGKLSNFQWKIGVSMASNNCKNLYDPFVSIRFDVLEDDGTVNAHTGELTFDQFRELKSCFEKAARAMDSI